MIDLFTTKPHITIKPSFVRKTTFGQIPVTEKRKDQMRAYNKANPQKLKAARERFKEKHPGRLQEISRESKRRTNQGAQG